MLKKIFLILTFATICAFCKAQETLIYHTSFEIDSNRYCNHSTFVGYPNLDSIVLENFYADIFSSLNSADIFSPCDSFWSYLNNNDSTYLLYRNSIPKNQVGFQYPYDGNNYLGIITYVYPFINPDDYYREWLGIKLPQTLIKNRFYKIEYYLSLSDYSGYKSSLPQIFFSADSISYPINQPAYNNDLSIIDSNYLVNTNTELIIDTISWTKLTYLYKSNGLEKYLYIGNFYNNLNTTVELISSDPEYQTQTYYYIDNFSIYDIDSTVNINENIANKYNVQIAPNPAMDFVTVAINADVVDGRFEVYDYTGKLIITKPLTAKYTTVNLPDYLPNSLYYVRIINVNEIIKNDKLVIIR